MKFNFNKKMVSTIVILIFGVAITVAALSAKNIALENKTSSEIATEAVSATEMILDTENTETSNVDKNSSDSSKDKATVVDDKDNLVIQRAHQKPPIIMIPGIHMRLI